MTQAFSHVRTERFELDFFEDLSFSKFWRDRHGERRQVVNDGITGKFVEGRSPIELPA